MKRAAFVFTLLLAACAAAPAFAGGNVQGTYCPSGTSASIGTGAVTDGNNLVCISNLWQYPVYVFQNAAASAQSSCTGYPAGAERWNTTLSNLEVCDGTTWQVVGVGTSSCGSVSGLSYTNVTSATLNTVYTSSSATITFSGCSGALSVSVTGSGSPQISVNGGSWSTSGAITSGQILQVRLTSSGSVSTGLTATVTVASSSTNWTVTTRAASLQVFMTANQYNGGTLGGLSGADAICQSEANTAGYAGTYKAILSDAVTSAASRLTLSYPIVNAHDGLTVAGLNLWAGSISNRITTPSGGTLCCHEFGWSGTTSTGAISSNGTCSSWSSTSTNGEVFDDGTGPDWIDAGFSELGNNTAPLLCIQQ